MATLNYLTVQDVIWLNTRITGRENSFESLNLEEGVFHQYASGAAPGAQTQAARLVLGLLKKQRFSDGNEGTAIASALVFLAVNGFDVDVEDLNALLASCRSAESALSAIEAISAPSEGHHGADISDAGEAILLKHGEALKALAPAAV